VPRVRTSTEDICPTHGPRPIVPVSQSRRVNPNDLLMGTRINFISPSRGDPLTGTLSISCTTVHIIQRNHSPRRGLPGGVVGPGPRYRRPRKTTSRCVAVWTSRGFLPIFSPFSMTVSRGQNLRISWIEVGFFNAVFGVVFPRTSTVRKHLFKITIWHRIHSYIDYVCA